MVKSTDDLKNELMETADLDRFLEENQDAFRSESAQELLAAVFDKSPVSKAELARRSGISEPYIHQIFSGRRNPSRDRLLCVCLALESSLEDTQSLLKQCGHAQLYAGSRRDAIILFGLLHAQSAYEVNDRLFEENEKTLF